MEGAAGTPVSVRAGSRGCTSKLRSSSQWSWLPVQHPKPGKERGGGRQGRVGNGGRGGTRGMAPLSAQKAPLPPNAVIPGMAQLFPACFVHSPNIAKAAAQQDSVDVLIPIRFTHRETAQPSLCSPDV